jgi:phytoene dehydrogenase-like protein
MAETHDVVVIGAGHNGLVTAYYLAKAGLRPLVLEARPAVGGGAITDEFHPRFRGPILGHNGGPLASDIIRDTGLERRGVRILRPDPRLTALSPDGPHLSLHEDPARTAGHLRQFSAKDAAAFPEFHQSLAAIGGLVASLMTMTPPVIENPTTAELWTLLKTGRRFRGLGKKDGYRLLRYVPMAVADLVSEWFETDLLRGALAARGIFGAFLGPWSAGSGAVFLLQTACEPHSAGPAWFVKGGPGALTRALADAAEEAGATVRTNARVRRIQVADDRTTGVVLESGDEITARAVVSNADPKRTFLGLIDPIHLDPAFSTKIRCYRTPGIAAKVNLALSRLPSFGNRATSTDSQAMAGRLHIGPGIDYLERAFDAAKYGTLSEEPYLDVTIPTILDPDLAPPGAHVMSVYVQYAPYDLKGGTWTTRADALGDTVVRTLARYLPDLPGAIEGRQVITPLQLEEQYGFTGGHIFHGEMALDQLFTMRPLLGYARYRTPIGGVYLCGAGTHPGGGLTGVSGLNAAREIVKDLRGRR